MELDKEQKDLLIKTLKGSRNCINMMCEQAVASLNTFKVMGQEIPKVLLKRQAQEREEMERIIDNIDESLKFLEKSDWHTRKLPS